jgi:glycosyltransferase involved in cell wall biosynthesis
MGAQTILDIHDALPELYATKFGSSLDSAVFRWLVLVERLSCRFADHVVVANDLWRQKLVRRSAAAEKCTTLLNYPDLRLFKPLAEKRKPRDGRFIILYPGTLNRHQGLDIAIKAFALAKDRMPNAEFHIYGEGPARAELMRLTKECGLNGRVRLMAPVPIGKIASIMASADLGVEPKKAEGFGSQALSTKILEFMACGVPAIVSRTEVHAYYFDDTLVRFFAPGNEIELAEALVEVYSHSLDQDWVRRALDFASRYSWQKRVVEYEDLIDSLAAKSPRHGRMSQ